MLQACAHDWQATKECAGNAAYTLHDTLAAYVPPAMLVAVGGSLGTLSDLTDTVAFARMPCAMQCSSSSATPASASRGSRACGVEHKCDAPRSANEAAHRLRDICNA